MYSFRFLLSTLILFSLTISLQSAEISIMATSSGPGRWIAHPAEPVSESQLEPFIGKHLFAGMPPKGVISPEDPKLLLARGKLGIARIVEIDVRSGGQLVEIITDPVVLPEVHSLKLGDVELSLNPFGLAANSGSEPVSEFDKRVVIETLFDTDDLKSLAKCDPGFEAFNKAWFNPKQPVSVSGWLRLVEGEHTLQVVSGRRFEIDINGESSASVLADDLYSATLTVESAGIEMEIRMVFPESDNAVSTAHFLTVGELEKRDSKTATPLTLNQFLVPWAPESPPEATIAIAPAPYELAGGSSEKGREVFFSQAAKCSSCHAIDGQGEKIGPELTGLRGMNPQLVFHHINAPSDRIHPAYPSFSIALKNGQVAMGVVRSLNSNEMEVRDTDARSLKFQINEIEEIRPSSSSIMPSGLAGAIGESSMRDLIAYLTQIPSSK